MSKITTTGYGTYTYNSKNPLKRFSHRSRFKHGESLIPIREACRILDFGCGDAMFLNLLDQHSPVQLSLMGYEPYLEMIAGNAVQVVSDWQEVIAYTKSTGFFDCVVCFEVLEHLSEKKQREVLEQILPVLSKDGVLVLSVPIEKGIPALIKNQFRGSSSNPGLYSKKNIIASFLGKDLSELRQGDEYLSHMGFYFSDLELVLASYFEMEERFFSPFKGLGYQVNSQVFYKLKRKTS